MHITVVVNQYDTVALKSIESCRFYIFFILEASVVALIILYTGHVVVQTRFRDLSVCVVNIS